MKDQLWIVFLKIRDKDLSYTDMKTLYSRAATKLNIPGCTGCKVNQTYSQFRSDVEDLSPQEIQDILNLNWNTMPTKKAPKKVTKKATTAVVKKKPTVKAKVTVNKEIVEAKNNKKVNPTSSPLPGGVKFLYIPTRK